MEVRIKSTEKMDQSDQSDNQIVQLKQKIFDRRSQLMGSSAVIDYEAGTHVRLIVKENNRKPGKMIFVREDGKCGFPTINSIKAKVGDVIEGTIKVDNDTCFFVEVENIVQRAITSDAQE